MLDSQTFNPHKTQTVSQLPKPTMVGKLGKEFMRAPAETASDARQLSKTENRPEWSQNESALSWYKVESDDEGLKLTAVPNTYQVDVTSVQIHVEEVSAPKDINLFGYRINLKDKIEMFQDNYVKN